MRNYGLSRRQASVGGGCGKPAGALAHDAQRDLNSFSLQPPLHSQNICDPPLNVGSFIRDAILGSVTAVSIVVSLFILIFVRVG